MKKLLTTLTLTFGFISILFAQDYSDAISTQRPGLTEGAPALNTKTIQIEGGYIGFDNSNIAPTVFRYAPFTGFETRVTTTWKDTQTFIGIKYTLPFKDFPVIFSINTDIQVNGNFGLARLAAYYDINNNVYLSANYGLYSSNSFALLQVGYALSHRFSSFVEFGYSVLSVDVFQTNLGLSYRITPNIQIDGAAGYDANDNTYLEIGGAFRVIHK